MHICTKCGGVVPAGASFCPHCGAKYEGNQNANSGYVPSGVKILCILTIVGSIFGIFRGLIYFEGDEGMVFRAVFYILSSLGTIAGAIMMLSKKLSGLYLYSASQIIYICTAMFASSTYDDYWGLTGFVTMIFVAPAVIFLILYWAIAREHLQ